MEDTPCRRGMVVGGVGGVGGLGEEEEDALEKAIEEETRRLEELKEMGRWKARAEEAERENALLREVVVELHGKAEGREAAEERLEFLEVENARLVAESREWEASLEGFERAVARTEVLEEELAAKNDLLFVLQSQVSTLQAHRGSVLAGSGPGSGPGSGGEGSLGIENAPMGVQLVQRLVGGMAKSKLKASAYCDSLRTQNLVARLEAELGRVYSALAAAQARESAILESRMKPAIIPATIPARPHTTHTNTATTHTNTATARTTDVVGGKGRGGLALRSSAAVARSRAREQSRSQTGVGGGGLR